MEEAERGVGAGNNRRNLYNAVMGEGVSHFVCKREGGLLALRPTHPPKKILTQNLAEGKSSLNTRPLVGPPQPPPPPLVSIPHKQSLGHVEGAGGHTPPSRRRWQGGCFAGVLCPPAPPSGGLSGHCNKT